MHVGRLRRVTPNGHTRTDEMTGVYFSPPRIGFCFSIWNDEPLDSSNGENMRMITTTPVQLIELEGNVYSFRTENTDYVLEVLAVGEASA